MHIERYDHQAFEGFNDPNIAALNREGPFVLVWTAFHKGGIVSRHRSLKMALKAQKTLSRGGCSCGCAGIISEKDYNALPPFYNAYSAFDLAKR